MGTEEWEIRRNTQERGENMPEQERYREKEDCTREEWGRGGIGQDTRGKYGK